MSEPLPFPPPQQPPQPEGIRCEIVFDVSKGIVIGIACPVLPNRVIMKGMLLDALRVVDVWNDQQASRIVVPPPGLDVSGGRKL